MDDSDQEYTPGSGETYAEGRRRRLHRDRVVGFAVCIALWGLSVIPLARESMHGRGGASAVAVFLIVGAITLGVAAVIRGIYFLLSRKRFWSPWMFLLAAVLAIGGYVAQSAGEGGLISARQSTAHPQTSRSIAGASGSATARVVRAFTSNSPAASPERERQRGVEARASDYRHPRAHPVSER